MIVIILAAYFRHIFKRNSASIVNHMGIDFPCSYLITFFIQRNKHKDSAAYIEILWRGEKNQTNDRLKFG